LKNIQRENDEKQRKMQRDNDEKQQKIGELQKELQLIYKIFSTEPNQK